MLFKKFEERLCLYGYFSGRRVVIFCQGMRENEIVSGARDEHKQRHIPSMLDLPLYVPLKERADYFQEISVKLRRRTSTSPILACLGLTILSKIVPKNESRLKKV